MTLPKVSADQSPKQPLTRVLYHMLPIPPLESGDSLTRAEFERRYQAMPANIRAELIEGTVYMSSPVRYKHHSQPHNRANIIFGLYAEETPGTGCGDSATVRLDLDNEPQPDVVLFIEAQNGGQVSLSDDDYLEGSPELVVEVSSSTVSIDLHSKLAAYRRNGIREYIVWRVIDNELDWFHLVNEQYVRLPIDNKGVVRSQVFPGLWVNVAALLKGDIAKVRATLAQGLASKEHIAFVRALKRRAKAKR